MAARDRARSRNGRRWIRLCAAVMAVLAVASVAPTADAQQGSATDRLDLRFNSFTEDHALPNGRIMPEVGVARIGIDAMLNVDMYNRYSTCATPVQVLFTVKGPSYATAVVVPSAITMLIGGGSSSGVSQDRWQSFPIKSAHLEITVGRDAPALADGLYEVTMKALGQSTAGGSAYPSCDLGESRIASATYRLKNDFVPRVSVSASNAFAKAGPNERIVLPITIANAGNGPARVNVTIVPSEADAFRSFTAGPAIRLDGPLGGGGSTQSTVYVDVTTPADWGYTNRISTLKAVVTTVYDGAAPGSTLQDTTQMTFTIQTEGLFMPVYGLPTKVIVITGLVSAALIGLIAGLAIHSMMVRVRARRAKRREEKAKAVVPEPVQEIKEKPEEPLRPLLEEEPSIHLKLVNPPETATRITIPSPVEPVPRLLEPIGNGAGFEGSGKFPGEEPAAEPKPSRRSRFRSPKP
jgi:hypothetical protein